MKKQREQWGSSFGFVMAAAGSAIGLGTLWLFPYITAANGGGLFVLCYLFFTVFIGIPVFIAELILGREARSGAVGVFSHLAKEQAFWQIIGWMGVSASFLIMSYYSVVAGWGLNYLFLSLSNFYAYHSPNEIPGVFDLLVRSGDICLFWHFAFTSMTVGVVYFGIKNGIEYWSRIMTSSLLLLLLLLFFFSLSLEGFPKALRFVFMPDFCGLLLFSKL